MSLSRMDDRKVQIDTFVIKFGFQGFINVMFEETIKVGSRVRRIYCIFDHEFHRIY